MSKNKIQIGSVEVKSNVEVIFLNSLFVAKTVRTAMLFEQVQGYFTHMMPDISSIDPGISYAMEKVEEYFNQLTGAFEGTEPEPAPEDKRPEYIHEPEENF